MKDVPGPPTILAGAKNYEKTVKISWKRESRKAITSTLYYSLRYKKLGVHGNTSWLFIDELANIEMGTYTTVLRNLKWGEEYLVEVYAGNMNGVGEPAIRMVSRPKGEETSCHLFNSRLSQHGPTAYFS